MGTYVRRFWMPLMRSSALEECDGTPQQVRLYGENLVAFRGLRCIYHDWKFDVNGICVDMPNESPETNFKDKVRADYYPAAEAAGVIWVYMGPKDLQPELPDMEWMRVPEEYRNVHRFHVEGNWVQAMEGDVDSSHIGFLHKAFEQSRQMAYEHALSDATGYSIKSGMRELMRDEVARLGEIFTHGIARNQTVVDLFLDYCAEQGVTRRRLPLDQVFAAATLDT